ncbi:ribonuclease M5 [Spiroplasma endosymbiont of Aspidapion aeneum]|uniref:ribonuclease M5 n=1 Tax=Spiroplasma endosymbiont of Aspidapion aeneum TaxID=3066276 RepID=UPI00313C8CAD
MKNNKIIIVEGKSDEAKLRSIFNDINIIVTNGFNIGKQLLSEIKHLSMNSMIIVFTDPDNGGNRIRKIINDYLDNDCYNAFIDRNLISNPNKKGIAEAEEEEIKKSLSKVIKLSNSINTMTWDEYLENNFYLKKNRVKIAKKFSWNCKISSKVLFKYINYMGLKVENIEEILNNE